jgi:hypothetical protein
MVRQMNGDCFDGVAELGWLDYSMSWFRFVAVVAFRNYGST